MEPNFHKASQVRPSGEGRFSALVEPSWLQGRGAYGGLAIGIAVRAMQQGESRMLRSLTAELPGPLVPGEADIEVGVMREGRGLTARQATVRQDGAIRLRVSGLFGTPRADELDRAAADPPRATPAREVPPIEGKLPPAFTQHLEYRCTGPLPFQRGTEARAEGWVRFRDPVPELGVPEIIGLADAFWPSVLATHDRFIPMATISFMLHLTGAAEGLDPAQPLLYRAKTETVSGGYLYELRELWTGDGRLVALNPQTFSIAPTGSRP